MKWKQLRDAVSAFINGDTISHERTVTPPQADYYAQLQASKLCAACCYKSLPAAFAGADSAADCARRHKALVSDGWTLFLAAPDEVAVFRKACPDCAVSRPGLKTRLKLGSL